MKRAAILFAVFFMLTLAIPMITAFTSSSSSESSNELVTIFSAEIILL